MKTMRRDSLLRQCKRGEIECLNFQDYDEFFGEMENEACRPVNIFTYGAYGKPSSWDKNACNISEHDFKSSCGGAHTDGELIFLTSVEASWTLRKITK